jgi:hypothetical protein
MKDFEIIFFELVMYEYYHGAEFKPNALSILTVKAQIKMLLRVIESSIANRNINDTIDNPVRYFLLSALSEQDLTWYNKYKWMEKLI